jgi:hypothetical protein
MSHDLVSRFSRSWFSTYEPELAFTVQCPVCDERQDVLACWSELTEGFGGNALVVRNAGPFVIGAQVPISCTHCGERLTVYLAGAAGGRQGEVQYGVAGLRYADTTLI